MSKSKKILLLIFCILILAIFLPILIDYHQVSDLDIHLFSWRDFYAEFLIARYVFWGTLVLSVLVLISMLVILFYPKQYLEIQLETQEDTLKLKNSAIEGFVRCLVIDHRFMKDPKVQVNSRKNKCFVYVEGTILPSENISSRCQFIQNEITHGLKRFFGIDKEVGLRVLVKEYNPQKSTRKSLSRVK